MISVIIPLYNKEKTIAKTLECVLAQTYQDFEIVIVNDGSSDSSVEVVKTFTDPRIRLINQQNAGVSAARNRGIAEAKGEFVAFLDADDEWLPDYLSTQYNLTCKFPDCDIFATNYVLDTASEKGKHTIIKRIRFSGDDGILSNYFEVASCSNPPLWTSAVMTSKKAIEAIGCFPIGIKSGEDLVTWAKLACNYKIAYTKNPKAIYHIEIVYDFDNNTQRKQDKGDPVGIELKRLLSIHNTDGLRQYISQWHKMRSAVDIRYFNRMEAFKQALISVKYYPLNKQVYPYLLLPFLPKIVLKRIFPHHE